MNPLGWKREHQIALLLAIAVGIVAGVVVGYLVYASGRGADGASGFGSWLKYSFRFYRRSFEFQRPGIWWGLTGGSVGAALIYIRILSQQNTRR